MKFISCLGHIRALREKKEGVFFAVWAPRAKRVSVVGDFNGWNPEADEMKCDNDMGIYQLFIPGVKNGDLYKYCITTYDDRLLYKADPYGNYAEMRPGNASRVTDLAKPFKWGDAAWLKKRLEFDPAKDAMSIYEVHPGSWKKHPSHGEDDPGFYNYRELAHASGRICERDGIYSCRTYGNCRASL